MTLVLCDISWHSKKATIQRWFLAFTPKEVLKADSFMDVATRFCW